MDPSRSAGTDPLVTLAVMELGADVKSINLDCAALCDIAFRFAGQDGHDAVTTSSLPCFCPRETPQASQSQS